MTTEELIAELESLIGEAKPDDDCFTAPQLARRKNWPESRARAVAKEWARLGRIKPDLVMIVNDWGQAQRVKGYRILPAG